MFFDLSKMAAQESYNLLNGLVAPRPIAWVTSMDLDGKLNAAPFSAYNYVGTDPPIVAIGIANLPGPGRIAKDTARNIGDTREFVINVVDEACAQAMVTSSIDFPTEINEFQVAGIETAPSMVVHVPRILNAPASLECREITTMEIGTSRIVLAQVVAIHVRDEFIDTTGPYVLAEELHAIGRMNGLGMYVRTRDSFFQIPRMTYSEWIKADR
jgi:flavin reductase (DIM6/NTAB) family NADH-FMN oxidoreductase RutF